MPAMIQVEKLKRIQDIYAKIDNQSIVKDELDELVLLSSELYEKALILRYKAAEERVFGVKENEVEIPISKTEESKVKEPTAASKEIDFSIFEKKVSTPEKEELVQEIVESTPEPKIVKEATVDSSSWSNQIEKIVREYDAGIQTPLTSISGSFGLNERILYINELFNGESEKFSLCVQKLEGISDWSTCVSELSSVAKTENWNMDNESTNGFILHINRKYA